jgi:hypothetical protein
MGWVSSLPLTMQTPRLSISSFLSLSVLSLTLASTAGCSGDDAPLGDDGETTGDGDGDPSTGDGDGDPSTGDGDGDPSTGDGDGDPSTGDGDGDPTDGEDTTPPSVTMTTPSLDQTGVLTDAVIEVSFSEPMDKASVQAAWQSPELPANAVTFAWDDAGTVLTVTPNDPLVIAEIDGLEDPAEAYSFSINSAATDLAGNGLEPELSSSFTTARRWPTTVGRNAILTNYVGSNGEVALNLLVLQVGDDAQNIGWRSFVTYNLDSLPEDMIELETASVHLVDWTVFGAPFKFNEGVGMLQLADVEFDAIQSVTYNLEPIETIVTNMLRAFAPEKVEVDVTDAVLADLAAERAHSQFRLSMTNATNNNGVADYIRIQEANLLLEVTVLVP